MTNLEKCVNLELAKNQRLTEINRGEGTSGTVGFQNTGCYDCNGYNTECKAYFKKSELKTIQ